MSPLAYKISKIRRFREKYSRLREEVILQTKDSDNSEITDREGIDTMNEAGKRLLDDADWEYFGEEGDITKSSNNGERSTSANHEVEPVAPTTTAAAAIEVETGRPEYQTLSANYFVKYGDLDWESFLHEDGDDKGAEDERDKSLGASTGLSELLALERDNPDDFGLPNLDIPYSENSSEAPTGDVLLTLSTVNSPGMNEFREKSPGCLGTMEVLPSIEEDGYDDADDYEEDDGDHDHEFPADEFVKTQAFITKAERRLRRLAPYKQYRVSRPSLLRNCYTVIP